MSKHNSGRGENIDLGHRQRIPSKASTTGESKTLVAILARQGWETWLSAGRRAILPGEMACLETLSYLT